MADSGREQDSWSRVHAVGHSLELPTSDSQGHERATSGTAEPASDGSTPVQGVEQIATLREGGVTVYLDATPFADPLTSYDDQAGAQRVPVTTADGREVEAVTFRTDDGIGVVAARLGDMTVAVHLEPGLPDDIGLRVLRSIREEEST